MARLAGGVIQRAQDIGLLVQIIADLPVGKGVVAQGDHVGPGVKDLLRLAGGDAPAHGRGVFAVDHGEVGAHLLFQRAKAAVQDVHPGVAHHVADG